MMVLDIPRMQKIRLKEKIGFFFQLGIAMIMMGMLSDFSVIMASMSISGELCNLRVLNM